MGECSDELGSMPSPGRITAVATGIAIIMQFGVGTDKLDTLEPSENNPENVIIGFITDSKSILAKIIRNLSRSLVSDPGTVENRLASKE